MAGEKMAARQAVSEVLAPFELVEIDESISAAAAEIRYQSRLKLMDAYILATAQVNGALLITRNTKDFPSNAPGIRVPYTL